jgi:hypothetical protein
LYLNKSKGKSIHILWGFFGAFDSRIFSFWGVFGAFFGAKLGLFFGAKLGLFFGAKLGLFFHFTVYTYSVLENKKRPSRSAFYFIPNQG